MSDFETDTIINESLLISTSVISQYKDQFREINSFLWKNPELAYKEFSAHKILTEFLTQNEFNVTPSYLLPTAFKATFHTFNNDHKTTINPCIICEYDALPKIGHACGHNLIAIAGIATALIIKNIMQLFPVKFRDCTLTVIGTPAEEEGGGKIDLIKMGGFQGVDFAMMIHPYTCNILYPPIMMMGCYTVNYSHGDTDVDWNVNLDAAVLAYNSIALLRQQLSPTVRIHGVILKGGELLVESTAVDMEWDIRAQSSDIFRDIESKSLKCFEISATTFNCNCDIRQRTPTHYNMLTNSILAEIFREKSSNYGIKFDSKAADQLKSSFSTDMGNVSYILPSIHPKYYIPTQGPNHTTEFAEASNTDIALECTLDAAKALALTAIEVMLKPGLFAEVLKEFNLTTKHL